MQGLLIENCPPVYAFAAKDITGAGVNGNYFNLAFARRALLILTTGAWAGGTAAVTLGQATTAAGGSAKALAFSYYYIATSTSSVFTKTAVVSNTFNLSAASKIVAIDLNAYDLDINNGFKYVRVEIATPGSNADLLGGVYVPYMPAYAGLPSTLPDLLA
jgi:hypothetical protein